MSDQPDTPSGGAPSGAARVETHRPRMPAPLVLFAGGALLGVMGADFIAVIGRHVGLPLLGSIEIVQALVLIAASGAILATTIAGTHAVVHLLAERVSPSARLRLERLNGLLCALFFLALTIAGVWLAVEMFSGHEESELLRIPFVPLRVILIATCAASAGLFVMRLRRPRL